MKPSELFKSMDEVRNFCEQFKTCFKKDDYKLLEMLFGIGEQEGLYIEIENIGKIDRYIAPFIKKFNNLGLKTLACCSGLKEDHPTSEVKSGYIAFLKSDKAKNIIEPIAKKLNLECLDCECYLQPSITVYFKENTEGARKQNLKSFYDEIIKTTKALS